MAPAIGVNDREHTHQAKGQGRRGQGGEYAGEVGPKGDGCQGHGRCKAHGKDTQPDVVVAGW